MRKNLVKLNFLFFLGIGSIAFAQTTGTLQDANGFPVEDVEVTVKGTDVVTYTDMDGNFDIDAKTGDVLVINGKEYLVTSNQLGVLKGDSNVIDLEETVIVAYGVQKKETVVGANAVISAEKLEDRAITNVTNALEGAAPGVLISTASGSPGSGLSVQIRGMSSYNLTNSPLYILDGSIYTGSLANLNPNDIESINILKDAASTSLYGSAAANGVVLITTKKGSKKRGSFSFNAYTGVVTRNVNEYDRVGPADYYRLTWDAIRNGYLASNPTHSIEQANAFASNALVTDVLKNNIYNVPNDQVIVNGQLNPNATQLYDDFDWTKYMDRTGSTQKYDLSYTGGSDTSNFYASFGYNKEKGYIIESEMERYNAMLSADSQVTDWLKLGISLTGSKRENSFAYDDTADDYASSSYINPFYFTRFMGPIYSPYLYNPNGELQYGPDGNPVYDGIDSRGRGSGASGGRNVIQEMILNDRNQLTNSLNSRAYAQFKLMPHLTFTTNIGHDIENRDYKIYTNSVIGDAAGKGALSSTKYTIYGTTFNQLLNYNRSFNRHNFDVVLGHEVFNYKYDYEYHRKETEVITGIYHFSNFLTTTSQIGYNQELRKESWFGRLNYDFDNKYIASLSLRNDKSSRFAEDKNSGWFWSAGLGWNIHREDFLKDSNIINVLKLRSSYGEVGNDGGISQNPGYQADLDLYNLGSFFNGGEPGVYLSQVGNKDLTWETNKQFDVALEYGLFNDRISGSVEYYLRETEDMIFNVPLPLSEGIPGGGIYRNIGTLRNSGVELALNLGIVRTEDFKWDLGINATTMKNEIIKMPDDQETIINGTKQLKVGQSLYDFWLRQWYGVDPTDGSPLFLQDPEIEDVATTTRVMADGTKVTTNINHAKYDYSGSAIPDLYGSINNSFKYKQFYLNALLTYQIGGKVYDSNYAGMMSSYPQGGAIHVDMLNAWQNPGDITNVPIMSSQNTTPAGASTSTRWLEDASYLNVRNVTLGYNFKSEDIDRMGLSGLKLYVSGENLFSWTKRDGLEPVQSFNGTTSYRYTPARIVALGLNVSF